MWEPRSAYLHVPFCHRRCYYCDFAIIPLGDNADGKESGTIEDYLKLLHYEISSAPKGPPLSTVYIGGGTPSILTPIQVDQLLGVLRSNFGLTSGAEISLEIDPSTFDRLRFEGYLTAGINRISLGAQSFDDDVLARLGRRHRSKHLQESVHWIREAFANRALISWSLDLIQGLPEQSLLEWKNQLDQALDLKPPHLSIYNLSIETGTVFAQKYASYQFNLPTNDEIRNIMELTSLFLLESGYKRYEISNFALPGHTSRHNRAYWSSNGWWGFGLSSSSAPYGEILARPRTRKAYVQWLLTDRLKHFASCPDSMPFDERLIVGMRRREGVDLFSEARIAGVSKNKLNELVEKWKSFRNIGLLLVEGERWRLSEPHGVAICNKVLRDMMLWWYAL